MSYLSAQFFARVQSAPFYVEAHRQAVQLLPAGAGRNWLDMGCGPGLVARLACDQGYDTTAVDFDPAMIGRAQAVARKSSVGRANRLSFTVGSVFDLPAQGASADVVSAASLLAVLPDRALALRALLSALRPGGSALLIEPSERMNRDNAARYLAAHPGMRMAWVLKLWAHTRAPRRAVNRAELSVPGWDTQCHGLLDGMLNAWVLTASAKQQEAA